MIVFIVIALVIAALVAFNWWITRSEEKRAEKWVASFHGEQLPPAETLKDKGHSTTFLLTVMPYYMEQGRKQRAKIDEWARAPLGEPFPAPKWNAKMLAKAKPIDPDKADDCPECDNGMAHENCRSGWKETLRENVREYAKAKFGSMPAWKSPCDTCGSNCGQCASSHCGVCGVKPRDGECDIVQHEAFKLHHEARPDRAEMRCEGCRKRVQGESTYDGTRRLWSDWSCLTCGTKHRRA